jgi:hypothetical protein
MDSARDRPRPAGRGGARQIGEWAAPCLDPLFARQGFAGREVVARWGEIVGERLASRSRPLRIRWPREPEAAGRAALPATARGATLHVRVTGAFALDLQHAAPVLLQRVNAVLGWPAIGRLVLEQGPVDIAPPPPAPAAPDPVTVAAAASAAAAIRDPAVRAATERLGRAVLARRRDAGRD